MLLATKAAEHTQGKGSALVAKAAEHTQGKGSALVAKAVETQGEGGAFSHEGSGNTQGKGSALATKAVEEHKAKAVPYHGRFDRVGPQPESRACHQIPRPPGRCSLDKGGEATTRPEYTVCTQL